MTKSVVEIQDLKIDFTTYEGIMKVLDGVNLRINKGEVLGLVGETGCGKTITGRAIMRILPSNARVMNGKIIFEDGKDLLQIDEDEMRSIRGKKISMIFQEPRRALHPTLPVWEQIAEVFSIHLKEEVLNLAIKKIDEIRASAPYFSTPWLNIIDSIYKKEINGEKPFLKKFLEKIPFVGNNINKITNDVLKEKSVEMLGKVQMPDPRRISNLYAHELSGGMMQRVLISMALPCNPNLLIADEPTTAVDVTTQAKILDLIMNLKKTYETSILLITHNLAVVAETCNRVSVMYAGTIVEEADTMSIFHKPMHPYTQSLLAAVPIIGRERELKSIPGTVPNFLQPPPGCRFHPRCNYAKDVCSKEKPFFKEVEEGHYVACHHL